MLRWRNFLVEPLVGCVNEDALDLFEAFVPAPPHARETVELSVEQLRISKTSLLSQGFDESFKTSL